MADYNINAVTRRVVYTGSAGTGPYSFTFEILDQNDVAVYFNSTLLTITTDYTVTINANGTGSITIVTGSSVPSTPDGDDSITIVGARDIERTTDFVTAGDLLAASLNEQLDALTIFDQQISERVDRGLLAPVTDPTTINMTLPAKADRLGKALLFNSTTGNPEAGPTATDIANAQTNAAAAAASATLASQWATKTDGQVASTDYSSKAWAIGGTGVTDTASAGAAKEWATAAEDDLVDGSEYSAKHYSAKASGFATNAEASATNAAASEAAAAAAAQGWADVVSITAGTTNIEITDANKYYILDASGGSITMNLPAVGTSDGLTLAFEVLDASNSITIARDGTDTINGSAADYTGLTAVGDVVHFISIDGTPDNWSARLISRFVVDGTTITQSGRTISTSRASASEVNTGTDTNKAVTPDALAGSNYGTAVVPILVFDDATDCATGDGAGDLFFRIPSVLNGFDLVAVAACCQTAGTTGTMDIQVHNVTQAADMLSTKITIDSGETDSSTAATPAVIDTNNDDVATGDQIRIDVDAVHSGTAAKGLLVELQFRLP
jgi:hypothetical protein